MTLQSKRLKMQGTTVKFKDVAIDIIQDNVIIEKPFMTTQQKDTIVANIFSTSATTGVGGATLSKSIVNFKGRQCIKVEQVTDTGTMVRSGGGSDVTTLLQTIGIGRTLRFKFRTAYELFNSNPTYPNYGVIVPYQAPDYYNYNYSVYIDNINVNFTKPIYERLKTRIADKQYYDFFETQFEFLFDSQSVFKGLSLTNATYKSGSNKLNTYFSIDDFDIVELVTSEGSNPILSEVTKSILIGETALYDYFTITQQTDLLSYLKEFYFDKYVVYKDIQDLYNRMKNINTKALYNLAISLEKLKTLYTLDYKQMRKTTRENDKLHDGTLAVDRTDELNGTDNKKRADNPSNITGELVDTYTTEQEKLITAQTRVVGDDTVSHATDSEDETATEEGNLIQNYMEFASKIDGIENPFITYAKAFKNLFLSYDPTESDIYESEILTE